MTNPDPAGLAQAMSACSFGRAGARCVRPYQELEAHCEESGERFPLLAMRLACGALTRALQPQAPRSPATRHPWRGDPLAVRLNGRVSLGVMVLSLEVAPRGPDAQQPWRVDTLTVCFLCCGCCMAWVYSPGRRCMRRPHDNNGTATNSVHCLLWQTYTVWH